MGTLYRNGVPFVGTGGAGGVEVTQAEYDALPTSEKMNGAIYFITDGDVSYPTASQMRYDNTTSQIPSTTVQGAIDENRIEINSLKAGLTWTNVTGFNTDKFTEIIVKVRGKELYISFSTIQSTFNEGDVLTTLPAIARPDTAITRLLAWNYQVDKVYALTLNSNGQLVCYGKGSISGRLICSSLVLLV